MLRAILLGALTLGVLAPATRANAQSFGTAAPGNYSFSGREGGGLRVPSSPAHRLEVAGQITLGVGLGVAVFAGLAALASASCMPSPGDLFGCIGAAVVQLYGEIVAGIGGLAVVIGAILWASSATASHEPPRVALVGGPGDVGAAVRIAF